MLRGGLFALAMPRGSGKSSLTEVAAIGAMFYGYREFIMLIGATESAALELLDSIMTEFEVNEHLAEDFPEVCFPIQQLDGKLQDRLRCRARRQPRQCVRMHSRK